MFVVLTCKTGNIYVRCEKIIALGVIGNDERFIYLDSGEKIAILNTQENLGKILCEQK